MTKVAIIHYSATGNVFRLAQALAEGASHAGAEVRLRRVAELVSPETVSQNPRWADHLRRMETGSEAPVATVEDIAWADGIALGSPTRFGGPAAQLKQLLDQAGSLWARGILANKVVTAFTSSSTAHGGLESTILATLNLAYHWGALIMPLGYSDPVVAKNTGNPYGASWVSKKGAPPDEDALSAGRAQGRRLARISAAIRELE